MLHKARPATLDLDTASSFLLDMLDVSASVSYNLSTKVESRKRLQVDGNTLLRPFALR